jgi:hypothetical protein
MWATRQLSRIEPPVWEMRQQWRCYMRDPDGYIIDVGQYTQMAIDWFNNHR